MPDRRLADAQRKPVDDHCDREVARLAAGQWGVLATWELRACGLSDAAISRRGRRGWLHRMHTGVWAVGHPNPPPEGQLLAAVKACGPGAVLSHRSAAELWGFVESEARDPEVTVCGRSTRVLPGIRVHRTERLERIDRRVREAIPVTAPCRTLLDLAGLASPATLRSAVRRAQALRQANLRQLTATLARLGPRRGSRRLAEVIATGPAPTRSLLEDVVLDLLLTGGFEQPDVNLPMRVEGRRLIPDFRWPAARLIVEADGSAWHDDRLAREEDAQRQALLEAAGERVLRVTWHQAIARRAETVARVRAAGAPLSAERRLACA